MKLRFLNQRHNECTPDLFERYRYLSEGGAEFLRHVQMFMPAITGEPNSRYEDRKRAAHYIPIAGPIIDLFGAQIFSAPLQITPADSDGKTVEPDPFYGEFKEDVDLRGKDLVSFMRERLDDGCTYRRSWIRCEIPSDDGLSPASFLEWQDRGLGRAVLSYLHPSDVLDWECDRLGGLLWMITHRSERRRASPDVDRSLVTETWEIIDATNVRTFEITYDPKKVQLTDDTEIPELPIKAHGFPRIPIVLLEVPVGLWIMNRLASVQVELFNLANGLHWAFRASCNPVPVFHLKEADKPPKLDGDKIGLILGNEDKTGFMQPDPGPFEVIAKRLDALRQDAYRIVHALGMGVDNNNSAVGRSGESKAQDNAITERALVTYGSLICEAVERIFELVSDARGDVDVRFSVEGLNRFNLDDVMTSVKLLLEANKLPAIPSVTYQRERAKKLVDLTLPDLDQATKDLIRDEIEADPFEPPAVIQDPSLDISNPHDDNESGGQESERPRTGQTPSSE